MLRYVTLTLLLLSGAVYGAQDVVSALMERLDDNNGEIRIDELTNHLDEYKYKLWRQDEKFISFIAYSDDLILPEMKAVVSFHDEKLVTIVTSSKSRSNSATSSAMAGGYYIYYYTMDAALIKEYEDRYLKDISFAG